VLTDNGVRVDVVAATAQRASAGKKNMNLCAKLIAKMLE